VKNITSNPKEKSTREVILQTIKSSIQANVEDLALAAEISPVTVRHHLNSLQADGLIEAASIRRKVGRPYYVYSLSQKGQELFPKRYVRLTSRLLEELKARLPEAIVHEVFKGVVQGVIEEHAGKFEHLPFEQRLDYLVDLLAEEGFLALWEKTADGYRLMEYSCPYLSIGRKHSEICTFDKELILHILQSPVQQHSCMLEGADCCHFTVSADTADSPL
jgi:DeoR family transcriptional regulator, suf operon transcriptional repressor